MIGLDAGRWFQLMVVAATQQRVLTGDRPTGPLHLGHYFGTIDDRPYLREIVRSGNDRAHKIAEETLAGVHRLMHTCY